MFSKPITGMQVEFTGYTSQHKLQESSTAGEREGDNLDGPEIVIRYSTYCKDFIHLFIFNWTLQSSLSVYISDHLTLIEQYLNKHFNIANLGLMQIDAMMLIQLINMMKD